MAAVAARLEEQLASALDLGCSRKVLVGVALGAVGLHELFALQVRSNGLVPADLCCVTHQRGGPGSIFAVSVGHVEAATLAVVANGATKVRELVATLPAAILEHIAHRSGVGMGAQRFCCRTEARVVHSNVAALAAIDALFAECSHNRLLELGALLLKRGFFCRRLR